MAEEGSACVICHDTFTKDQVGALPCGHVYHQDCVVKWFAQGKTDCPLCHKKTTQRAVRRLAFQVKQVPRQSPQELQYLEAATLEERERRREELSMEKAQADEIAAEVDGQLAELLESAQEHKRARKELVEDITLRNKEHADLQTKLFETRNICSVIQISVDAEVPLLQRKLPIKQPRSDDLDLREERRKLRGGLRPADRVRQLHEALYSAQQQEIEKKSDKNEREMANKKVEDELGELRQLEVQLKRELEEQRSTNTSDFSSQVSSQSSTLPKSVSTSSLTSTASASATPPNTVSAGSGRPGTSRRGDERREAAIDVPTPHGVAAVPMDEDNEDADFLYGGAPRRRLATTARQGLFSATPPATRGATAVPITPIAAAGARVGGSKWGALFGASGGQARTEATASQGATVPGKAVLQKSNNSMKSLFANRRA